MNTGRFGGEHLLVILVRLRMLARQCLYCPLEKLMPESTRREVLISIAAGRGAAEAPGAGKAGVAAMIDEDADAGSGLKRQVQEALSRLRSDGFADMSPSARTALRTDCMISGDERRQNFQLINDLTVDRYYATEIELVHGSAIKATPTWPNSPAASTRSTPDGPRRR